MFIQVITARVVDAEKLSAQLDRWDRELRESAQGFLGSTSGVTDDGRFVALARFESAEAAERNSQRAEQAAWWTETEPALEDVSFQNGVDVVTTGGGGSNDAGFVQVMRGRVADPSKMDALRSRLDEFEAAMSGFRPDVIGDVMVIHDDGSFNDAVYFTSEAEARANEQKEPPSEVQAMFGEWSAAVTVDEYLDLRQPRFL